MKKIIEQLHKLFPNAYMVVKQEIVYSDDRKTYITEYSAYLQNCGIYNFDWSNSFNTLKQLDEDLSNHIKDYKRIYKHDN